MHFLKVWNDAVSYSEIIISSVKNVAFTKKKMKYFKVEINNEISFGKLQKNAARKVHFLHRDDDDEEEEFAKISSNRHCETFLDDTTMMDQPVESSSCSSFIATINNDSENDDAAEEEEEDYSASVNAIIKRRNSSNKKKLNRKEQSLSERRCSSVYTTSSAETAITIEETQAAGTSEVDIVEDVEVYNKINLHKEVLNNIKMQPWNMRKKIKLVIQAKNYIKKHEGQLQERLAQSHSTKDMLEKWNIVLIQKWQKWKRELTNMSMWFIPWELKIKEIESHFGSVVASYFLFLRWLFWVNIVISVVIISFVTIPEIIATDAYNQAIFRDRKLILPEEKFNSTNLFTIWDFKGILKYSPLFYGWYTNRHYNDTTIFTSFNNDDGKNGNGHHGYRLPFAYFITGLMVYAYSFFATLRKMAENSRMSKLSEKDDECIFSWKLFTAWDYMIGNAETAHNRVASIIMGFKEALLEEAEKHKESRNWRVICIRILINGLFLGLLTLSVFAVVIVVKRSTEPEVSNSVWRQNEITLVLSLITFVFPMLFEFIGRAEQYHPRKQLRLQLTRVMILNLLNLYSLIFALFDKINGMTKELQEIKANLPKFETALPSDSYSSSSTIIPDFQCFCSNEANVEIINNNKPLISLNLMLEIVENLTSSVAALDNIDTSSSSSSSSVTDESIFMGYFKNSTEYLLENFTRFIFDNFTTDNADENFNFSSTLFPSTNLSENFTEIFQNFTDFIETNTTFEYLTEILENITASSSISDYEEFTKTSFTSSSSTEVVETATTNFPITEEAATQNIQDSYCYNFCKKDTKNVATKLNYSMNAKLRNLCWETMFGQELIKLTVMDLILTGLSILALDFFRGIFVRVMNRCWCWDIEKKFPSYGDFKVAENILHLVNNQGMVWMGMFFAPGLVVLNVIKLFILMYLRSWAVLTCNVPHSIIFRASRSNNFYYALLLMMLFLCVLPVGYAIVWIEPSWHCGPFSGYARIFHIFTKTIRANVPQYMHRALDYVASPGIVIPLLLLLILIIYYLVSLTGALREANIDLKTQLRRERTEERRKMFKLADQRHRGDANNDQTPLSKWKKLLFNLPSNRSYEDTTTMREESDDFIQSSHEIDEYNNDADAADADDVEEKRRESKIISKVFFSKLIKKALGKTSSISQDDEEEQTDIDDQHESLPDDEALEFRNLQNIVRKWSSSKRKNFANKDVERQDSSSSSTKWSENIPVIKIISSEPSSETIPLSIPSSSNKPSAKTIKCSILQKTEAIDEI